MFIAASISLFILTLLAAVGVGFIAPTLLFSLAGVVFVMVAFIIVFTFLVNLMLVRE